MLTQASFGRRLTALTIDWFMCLLIAGLISGLGGSRTSFTPLGLFFIEVFILTALTGSSAGQKVMLLKVVDMGDGSRVNTIRILIRTLLLCLVFPALMTKEGRGYHDIFANSIVVWVKKPLKTYLLGSRTPLGIGPFGIGIFNPPTPFKRVRTSRSWPFESFLGSFFTAFCNLRRLTWPL